MGRSQTWTNKRPICAANKNSVEGQNRVTQTSGSGARGWKSGSLRSDSSIVLDSPGPYEAEPAIATLEIIRQGDSDELGIS